MQLYFKGEWGGEVFYSSHFGSKLSKVMRGFLGGPQTSWGDQPIFLASELVIAEDGSLRPVNRKAERWFSFELRERNLAASQAKPFWMQSFSSQ